MKHWTPKEIRELRHTLGLTQKSFAKLLGVSSQFISYLERGERTPRKPFKLLLEWIEKEKGKQNEGHF